MLETIFFVYLQQNKRKDYSTENYRKKAGSLYFMQFAPKQAVLTLNEAQKKKVENMGRFITTMYINDLTFVNFSDAQAQNVPNINILFPYGAYLQNEQMMQLEVYVAKKYLYMQKPSELYRK